MIWSTPSFAPRKSVSSRLDVAPDQKRCACCPAAQNALKSDWGCSCCKGEHTETHLPTLAFRIASLAVKTSFPIRKLWLPEAKHWKYAIEQELSYESWYKGSCWKKLIISSQCLSVVLVFLFDFERGCKVDPKPNPRASVAFMCHFS